MIEGKNILIRQLESGDEEFLYKWWNNGKVMEDFTDCYGILKSKSGIRKNLVESLETEDAFPKMKRFMILTKGDHKPIGEIFYNEWNARNQVCKFGILIGDLNERGKKYGKDALYHFIDFMFKFLNLNKVELKTMSNNNKAIGLYQKMGFKDIGYIRDGYFDSRIGEFSDVLYMDLLKRDWLKLKDNITL